MSDLGARRDKGRIPEDDGQNGEMEKFDKDWLAGTTASKEK